MGGLARRSQTTESVSGPLGTLTEFFGRAVMSNSVGPSLEMLGLELEARKDAYHTAAVGNSALMFTTRSSHSFRISPRTSMCACFAVALESIHANAPWRTGSPMKL